MNFSRILVPFVSAVFCLPVTAQEDGRSPLEAYRGATQFHIEMCQMAAQVFVLEANAHKGKPASFSPSEHGDYAACINEGEIKSKKLYQTASDTLESQAAKDALKSYHIAFSTTLKGVPAGRNESQQAWETRLQGLKDKMNEAWVAFELEQ